MSNKKLIDEYPLLVLPSLAVCIGLNEAIILQQINYWLETYKRANNRAHYRDEKWWVYNSKSEWRSNFPWWSESTIWRGLKRLRELGLVNVTSKYNKMGYDRTLWYTIDYSAVDSLPPFSQNEQMDNVNLDKPFSQNEQMDNVNLDKPFSQNEQMDNVNLGKPIPETTHETTHEINHETIIPHQQNPNVSDNLTANQPPDIDFSFSDSTETPPRKQPQPAPQAKPPVVDDTFSDWEATPAEKAPRPRRTAEDVINATRASTAKYHERQGQEPWRDWFPEVMRPHGGVSKERLQWLGWRICQFSGQKPTAREARVWISGLASFYLETNGNPAFIDQCIMTGLGRDDPQYRPTHPAGYTKIAVKHNAANHVKVGVGGVVSTEYCGPGGAVEVPGAIYEESLERYYREVNNVE